MSKPLVQRLHFENYFNNSSSNIWQSGKIFLDSYTGNNFFSLGCIKQGSQFCESGREGYDL